MTSDSDRPIQVFFGYRELHPADSEQGYEVPLREENWRLKFWYLIRMLRYEVFNDEVHDLSRQQ